MGLVEAVHRTSVVVCVLFCFVFCFDRGLVWLKLFNVYVSFLLFFEFVFGMTCFLIERFGSIESLVFVFFVSGCLSLFFVVVHFIMISACAHKPGPGGKLAETRGRPGGKLAENRVRPLFFLLFSSV